MLRVHRSHRGDLLVAGLAADLATPHPDPFVRETVVVQSRGMERWLSHRLAEVLGATGTRDGVCANVRFAFPGAVVGEVLDSALGDDPRGPDPWDPDRLTWTILEVLPTLLGEPGAGRLRWYLGDDDGQVGRRRWVLARELADLLDRYAMYRPRMVASWSAGDDVGPEGEDLRSDDRWQAILWQHLAARIARPSPDRRYADAIAALADQGRTIEGLPHRLALFGTSALPPVHLRLLAALATRIPVTLHLTSPSPDLWRRLHEASKGEDSVTSVIASVARTQANPLLVSCGRLARDSQATLEVHAPGYVDAPADPTAVDDAATTSRTLLATIQADVIADRDRGGPTPPGGSDPRRPAPITLDPQDRSVQVHACHGPSRQVEVLHDALLAAFDELDDLEPRDVLVMAPDIETYAPHVGAIFGGGRGDVGGTPPAIPYALADRSLGRTNPVAEALTAVVELPDSRAEASRLLDLLALAPVRERFGIREADLATIRDWIAQTGVRWGLDPGHRAAHGQPAERPHTLRFGLDRLLVGVVMADEDDRVVADVAPYDAMEGDGVELLDRFVAFCETVFEVRDLLGAARPVDEWGEALRSVVSATTAVADEDAWVVEQVHRAIDDLVATSAGADGSRTLLLDLPAVREALRRALGVVSPRAGYETGAVTFSSMVPLRSIPHRVVCLLGLDDGVFPRVTRPFGFDLIAAAPQVGDRTARDEDRYLLLEAILAAGDRLVVTYTGRDVRTNEERPPAVPLGELLDVIDRSVVTPSEGVKGRDLVTTRHPLQAFSPRNFGVDERGEPTSPLSFDTVSLAAASARREQAGDPPPFFPRALHPDPEADDSVVELDALATFLADPVKWILRRRVGLDFFDSHTSIADVEPLEVDGLGRWALGEPLLARSMRDDDVRDDLETWRRVVLARGNVPVGAPGRDELDRVAATVETITATLAPHVTDAPVDVNVDVEVDGRRVVGLLRGIRGSRLVRWRFARLKAKDEIDLWVRHLALTLELPDVATSAVHVARAPNGDRAGIASFGPLATDPEGRVGLARAHLAELVGLHRTGRDEPIPLFPQTSKAYAAAIAGGADDAVALTKADEAWRKECADEHLVQVYGARDLASIAASTSFAEVARTVWLPILGAEPAP